MMYHRLIDLALTAAFAVAVCLGLHWIIADSVASGVAQVCGVG
jgi:hypothetical protein